ncbi:MAG: hypothetical protein JXR70_04450 [Spirochaetales bacterium]|nr:hypothetical protein [Spirochaetales bacterium]
MAECEFINKCPFFHDKLENKPDSIQELKKKYCLDNNLNCARYMVAISLGPEKMPSNLYPHEKDRAYVVIAENS